jgi:hypothetical protein
MTDTTTTQPKGTTMLSKILCALALAIAVLVPAPSQAAVFTDLTHAADDSGYAAPIHVICRNDGSHRYLYTGESTFLGSKACGGLGVDKIVVGYDQAVRCFNALPPYQSLYYMQGTRELPSYASLKCYMQRPL